MSLFSKLENIFCAFLAENNFVNALILLTRVKFAGILILVFCMTGCGDNLFPSGGDKRPPVVSGSTGGSVSQKAPDFSVSDINGSTVTLSSSTSGKKGAVFYFTMWCSLCDVDMSKIHDTIVPLFPDVNFYLVDYVSGSVAIAASSATADGYAGGVFTVLADTNHTLTNNFQGTMGTTVVIDSTGTVLMNELFKDGTKLQSTLAALP